ncbi:MAG: hypothetical protein BZY81_02610 [SAR202 cluster bacterium Io17-Chloro-G4]|nr:MAG: hypothetical protein BZY81_02610 [SAR202 cluster bacterium Io17-Chloro-G4]
MSFTDAFRILNGLKRRKIIKDYAVIGAIAASAYMEAIFTEDLDVIVSINSDEEYLRVFRRMGEVAEGQEGMHHIIGGVPVQMFPSNTKPLFQNTLDQALPVKFGRLRSKFASAEHLILLYLEPFREKDKLRIMNLMPNADIPKLRGLIERYDDEKGTLARRLQELHGTGFP